MCYVSRTQLTQLFVVVEIGEFRDFQSGTHSLIKSTEKQLKLKPPLRATVIRLPSLFPLHLLLLLIIIHICNSTLWWRKLCSDRVIVSFNNLQVGNRLGGEHIEFAR
jgi:hypothetical protein